MARVKSNSELVKEFLAAEREKGMEYFFGQLEESHATRSVVFGSFHGDKGKPVAGNWLKERIRQWLTSSGETRTEKQLVNLTRAVIVNVPGARTVTAA